jgi:hypothetical protein
MLEQVSKLVFGPEHYYPKACVKLKDDGPLFGLLTVIGTTYMWALLVLPMWAPEVHRAWL